MIKREYKVILQNFDGQKIEVLVRGYDNGIAYLEYTHPTTGKSSETIPKCVEAGFEVAREQTMELVDQAEKSGYTIIFEYNSEI